MRMTLTLVLLVLFAIPGFALAQEERAPELDLVGSAQLVGTSHFPVLLFTAEDGKKYSLGGPFYEELKRIERIKIRIFATASGKKQEHPHLSVLRYEILDVGDGVKPFVGSLSEKDGLLILSILDTPVTYALQGNMKVLGMLKKALGGRVWIAGDVQPDGTLKIRKFGILSKTGD
jgi:hypothetical protein